MNLLIKYSFKNLFFSSVIMFALLSGAYKYFTYNHTIENVHHKIQDTLLMYKSIRTYVSDYQKSELYRLKEENILYKDYFRPEVLSSTFSAKSVNDIYNSLRNKKNLDPITIKFASGNPRNPKNKATKKEELLIKKFNEKKLTDYTEIFDNEKGKVMYYAVPTRPMTQKCLTCHTTPDRAPKDLVKLYGDKNGFYEKEHQIRALLSTYYPLNDDLRDGNKLFFILSFITFTVFAILLLVAYKMQNSLNLMNKKLDEEVHNQTKKLKNQTQYLQTILDNTPNMVILTNGKNILDGNKTFLNFFNYETLEDFEKNHSCISDYFKEVDDRNFLFIDRDKKSNWVEHLLNNRNEEHKVKILRDDVTKYFSVKAEYFDKTLQVALVIFSDITKIENQKKEFEKVAKTDTLTKISNRFQFQILFSQEIKNSSRYKKPLSIIFFDLDHFKSVNDSYGHDVGDYVLIEVTQLIQDKIRDSDIFARWGGEEFVIVLPKTDMKKALSTAEKLREKLEKHKFKTVKKVTGSFGVATMTDKDTKETLLKRADEALYKAKEKGRNRVEKLIKETK